MSKKKRQKRTAPRVPSAPMTWMHKVRLRAFAMVVAVAIAAIGIVAFAALPVLPVVGVAVATVALMLNKMTAKLGQPVCWGCGKSIAGHPAGDYGVICPDCGTLSQIAASGMRTKV